MDSSVPLRGFGPSKDGAGFGKLTRQRQAVREHITGGALPERLLPRMPPAEEEDLAVVEQLIKASGKTRRRRKKSRDSAGSGQSVRRQQVVERSKSTPLVTGAPGARGMAGAAVDEKPLLIFWKFVAQPHSANSRAPPDT